MIDDEHFGTMLEYCDFDNDGNLDACEIHDCIVIVENEWRAEACPEYPEAVCECTIIV